MLTCHEPNEPIQSGDYTLAGKKTIIITASGSSFTVFHNRYYTKDGERWHFSINVERYRYKNRSPLIRYNAKIVAQRTEYSHPNTQIDKEIIIYHSHRRTIYVVNKAQALLQSLLQSIDNRDPVWDVRKLI